MGVVFATGNETVFGNLARTLSKNKNKETTFDIRIKNVSKILLIMTDLHCIILLFRSNPPLSI